MTTNDMRSVGLCESRVGCTNTTAPFATVAAKRPAGITVHARMLTKCCRAVKHRTNTAQNSIAMPASHLHPHRVFSARTPPLRLSQLSQRNGPLESRCMRACSKSGSLCADCGLCQAACCQAPDKYCTKQHSDAGISSASPSRLLGSNTTAPFATVAAKRPAGITVHASMLKERFLMR